MSHELPLASLDASELRELRETVRDAASESGYPEGVRALEESDTGLDADLWRLLAEEIGLAGVGLPEEVGGLGGLAEILAVAEELGATLAPVPFVSSTVLAGQILAACGEAAKPYLERISGGEIAGPALVDTRGAWNPDAVGCTLDGDQVTGSVRFVPFGASAAFFVVAARTPQGIAVAIVEADDATVTPLASLDFSRPSATVAFDASPAVMLAADGEACITAGVDIALVAVAADQLGGSQRCFDMTLEYIKVRRQFNREIGSFQAIKHRMADALMQVEMARSGLEKITWAPVADFGAEASVIKAWGSDSYNALAAEAIQLHGGIGFTWEHDAHLYFRRARYDAAFLGDANLHRERVASLLGW
ncbi:MAG: acyl-CoA/acyl-ACP dehydrogenase [Candidatus Nanopelagicales bacterium]|nr:acyl-CoA/acyl-ACP dehydrogenase [Candidatus Nanopelagicales bacterium]MCF8538574.1 acyl-CoA/acyl-ACP dehydrogenase [Candidatus Nanopelagicales bacterium]